MRCRGRRDGPHTSTRLSGGCLGAVVAWLTIAVFAPANHEGLARRGGAVVLALHSGSLAVRAVLHLGVSQV